MFLFPNHVEVPKINIHSYVQHQKSVPIAILKHLEVTVLKAIKDAAKVSVNKDDCDV